MGDGDELFARIIAGLDVPPTFGCSRQTVATTSSHTMAASSSVNTAYTAGAQHHEVFLDDPEYLKIKSDLENAGLLLKRLVKLTNTVLEEMFQTEADYLLRVRPSGFSLNVQYLYHGTRAPFLQICDEGLDERLSRSGRFGRGIYFSDNPQKCCKYAPRHKDESYLLRCKVIMGDIKEYQPGEEDRVLQKEPLKTVKDGKRVYYDSVKGQPRHHNEYVIYDKRRALIEYVVFYSMHPLAIENPAGEAAINHESGTSGGHSRSSSPGSGSNSPTSGRASPAGSDSGTDDVLPVTYTQVKRVDVERKRTQRLPTQPDTVPVAGSDVACASAAATTVSTTSALAASTSSVTVVPRVLTSEVYTSPQSAALRYLIDMKDKLSADQHAALTKEYHRTYGSLGPLADNFQGGATASSSLTEPDPVSEVMSKLIKEFRDVTQCSDDEVCRTYIEIGQMDLNRAVEAYIDAVL